MSSNEENKNNDAPTPPPPIKRFTNPGDPDFVTGKPPLDAETKQLAASIGFSENDVWGLIEAFSPIKRPRGSLARAREDAAIGNQFGKGWVPCKTDPEIKVGDIVEVSHYNRIKRLHVVTAPHSIDSPGIQPAFRGREYIGPNTGWCPVVARWPVSWVLRVVGHWDRFQPGNDEELRPPWTPRKEAQGNEGGAQ